MDSLLDRIRRSIAQRGFFGTVAMCWVSFLWLVRPAARRAEALRQQQDAAFDRQYGVDTGGIVRPKEDEVVGSNWALGGNYQAVDPSTFTNALNALDIPHPEFTFIDFGSGKGRALLLAAQYPFKKVIGVEYCKELSEIARQNFTRFPASARRCEHLESIAADAASYELPADPLVLYFYHPFAEPVMRQVVQNVTESFKKKPRRIIVVYLIPYFAPVWEATGCFKRLQSNPAIFDTGPVTRALANKNTPQRNLLLLTLKLEEILGMLEGNVGVLAI